MDEVCGWAEETAPGKRKKPWLKKVYKKEYHHKNQSLLSLKHNPDKRNIYVLNISSKNGIIKSVNVIR